MLTAWLNGTNPVVDLALSETGELTFANAATRAAVAKPAEKYTVRWARFDNATATAHPVGGEQTVRDPKAPAPAELLAAQAGLHLRRGARVPSRPAGVVTAAVGVLPPDRRPVDARRPRTELP